MGARRVTPRVVYGSRTWYGHAPGVLASLLALCWHGCCCLLAAAPAVSAGTRALSLLVSYVCAASSRATISHIVRL